MTAGDGTFLALRHDGVVRGRYDGLATGRGRIVMVEAGAPVRSGPRADDAGFREWMAVRAPALRRKAFLLCGDWHSADDLVQDTLLAMYPRWARIARGTNVDGYAGKVLVGKYVDAQRRPWRRERAVETVPEAPDAIADRAFRAVDDGDGPLTAALASLPVGQRAVLILRFTDDLSVDEIARVMGLPPGTVKSRLSRGTDAVRAHLGAQGIAGPTHRIDQLAPAMEDPS